MLKKRPTSHYLLILILLGVIIAGLYFSITLTSLVKDMATLVSTNMSNTMDAKAADPGTTQPEKYEIEPTSQKVMIGAYLERIEELDIKQSSWTYEFYLWFKWNPRKLDLLGSHDDIHKGELPFTIINGDILHADKIEEYSKPGDSVAYIQYFVKGKSTQFFDVSLYPIDKHDLILPIEHKWLDRTYLYFEPDRKDSKVSSRVMINGYDKGKSVQLIEKPHAYKSARGNPKLGPGYKVNFSQFRMSQRIEKGGLSVILKLFLILYVAVIVTFIAPFASDPSRYTVGALFTTAGANYVLSSKLPAINVYSFAEIINTFCIVVIILMMGLLAVLPSLIFVDGKIDPTEQKLSRWINISMFVFFIVINVLLTYSAIKYSL